MHSERVGQLKGVHGFVAEFPVAEAIFVAELAGELDLDLPRESFEFFCFILSNNNTEIAIGNVGVAFWSRPYVTTLLIDNVDNFVAVKRWIADRTALVRCDSSPPFQRTCATAP